MSEAIQRESALHGAVSRFVSSPGGGLKLTERGHLGYVNLRGDASEPGFVDAVRSVLGVELPCAANTVAEGGLHGVLWLGPDEWLVVTAPMAERGTANVLRTALAGRHVAVTEVGGGMTCIRLDGAPAREVLQRECPLDLHPKAFRAGQCAQSHLIKAPVLLRPLADGRVDLFVRRSFADYVWRWLVDAGAEFGVTATRE
jgi:sarcosine oxidase subunit gamma